MAFNGGMAEKGMSVVDGRLVGCESFAAKQAFRSAQDQDLGGAACADNGCFYLKMPTSGA